MRMTHRIITGGLAALAVAACLVSPAALAAQRSGTADKSGRSGCPAGNQQQKERAHHTLPLLAPRRNCRFSRNFARPGSATFPLPKCSTLS
jgi:hypothetical protein